MTTCHNMRTGEYAVYTLPPKEAVVCAYQQLTKRDYNTWNYDMLQVETGEFFYFCGDWAARKEGHATWAHGQQGEVERGTQP